MRLRKVLGFSLLSVIASQAFALGWLWVTTGSQITDKPDPLVNSYQLIDLKKDDTVAGECETATEALVWIDGQVDGWGYWRFSIDGGSTSYPAGPFLGDNRNFNSDRDRTGARIQVRLDGTGQCWALMSNSAAVSTVYSNGWFLLGCR